METITLTCNYCGCNFDVPEHKSWRKTCSPKCAHAIQAIAVREIMLTNNPMKCPDIAAKMSKTRSARFQNDPKFRESVAEYTRKAWADGKYEGVRVGQCNWHEHTKPDGSVVKLQGTWELAYAQWLDDNNILYETHVGRLSYIDENEKHRSYYPDFRLIETDEYVDVKNPLYEVLHASKINQVRNCNPNIILTILGKKELLALGVNLS